MCVTYKTQDVVVYKVAARVRVCYIYISGLFPSSFRPVYMRLLHVFPSLFLCFCASPDLIIPGEGG